MRALHPLDPAARQARRAASRRRTAARPRARARRRAARRRARRRCRRCTPRRGRWPSRSPSRGRRHASAHQPSRTLSVERAVGRRLHAARAARLERAARRVEPHVDAAHERARDAHVVVLEEDDAPAQPRVAARVDDRANQLLAAVVLRVRLAGEDELHRAAPGRRGASCTRSRSREEQRRALVGGEAAREADRQRVRVEHLVGQLELLARRAAPLGRRAQPAARVLHEAVAPVLVDLPQLGVGDLGGARPELRVVAAARPSAGRGSA